MTYTDIRQGDRFTGVSILHVADETNCTQFIHVSYIGGVEASDVFPFDCDEHGESHAWRRVWVLA